MSLRINIEHRSRYRYTTPVDSSFNELRITPLTTTEQVVLDSRVQVTPRADLYHYIDYWGSVVHAFDLHEPPGDSSPPAGPGDRRPGSRVRPRLAP